MQLVNADGSLNGSDFIVNSFSTGNQLNSASAALADGGFVVVWQTQFQDFTGYAIKGQRFNADGSLNGSDFIVNTYGVGDQDMPSVTGLADGGFVVAWQSEGQDGDGAGVYAQRYAADGSANGGEFRLSVTTSGEQTAPDLVELTGGDLVAAWSTGGTFADDVIVRLFTLPTDFNIYATAGGFEDWEVMTGSSVDPVIPPLPSDTLVVWPNIDGTVTYIIGYGFEYNLLTGEPTAGTVTTLEHRSGVGGTLLGDGQGLSLSLVTLYGFVGSDDADALENFLTYVFAGDDNFTSEDPDDTEIAGFAGDDVITAGPGSDMIEGGPGANVIDGGDNGILGDTASYLDSSQAVQVDLGAGTAAGGDAAGDVLTNIENLMGSGLADTLTGDDGDNFLEGAGGADVLDGGEGDDFAAYTTSAVGVTVNLGTGVATGGDAQGDTFTNIEHLVGSAHADTLTGDDNANIIEGGGGADAIDGADQIWGVGWNGMPVVIGPDIASYVVSPEAVSINLELGTTSGGDAAGDTLTDIEGLMGSSFDDTLIGDGGQNWIAGMAGADYLDGGGEPVGSAGDFVDYELSPDAVTVDLEAGTGSGGFADGDQIYNFENILASVFDDTLYGSTADNGFQGGYGADYIDGRGGNDTAVYEESFEAVEINLATGTVSGGTATGDTLVSIENLLGSAFGDVLIGSSVANVLIANAGDDRLSGGAGGDVLDGGDGTDTADYQDSNTAIVINLGLGAALGGHAAGDTLSSIENIIGSAFNDTIYGDANVNVLTGGAGQDTLAGQDGDDQLFGGDGNDALSGGNNDDELNGEAGDDRLFGNTGNDTINGGAGDDFTNGGDGDDTINGGDDDDNVLVGGNGNDTIHGDDGSDGINGSDGDDMLYGDLGNDRLYGGTGLDQMWGGEGDDTMGGLGGDDTLYGGEGADGMNGGGDNDIMYGEAGEDRLFGGLGADTLVGGADNDLLVGQGGIDTFVFEANWGHDQISGYGLDVTGLPYVDEVIDMSALGITFADLTIAPNGVHTLVYITADGSANNTIEILYRSTSTITESDFLF